MAPKTVTPWAQTLLHCKERFKVIKCWQLGGVHKCRFWMGCWFHHPLPYLGFDVVWVWYPTMLCWFQAMKVGFLIIFKVDMCIGLRKLAVLTSNIHQIQANDIISFFIPMFSAKANMIIYLFFISITYLHVCAMA